MEWFLPGAFGVLFVAFFVSTIGLVIWTLVDVVRMPGDPSFKAGTQLVWVIVILLGGLIGAIIYLAVGRPPGGATAARQRLPAGGPPPPPPPSGAL
jgi:Phospholipase_D-nuclease N-terminal